MEITVRVYTNKMKRSGIKALEFGRQLRGEFGKLISWGIEEINEEPDDFTAELEAAKEQDIDLADARIVYFFYNR